MSPALQQPSLQDITVEDNSPTVMYMGAWSFDPNQTLYSGSSYHLTHELNATAIFSFAGEYVWYISDLNKDHGEFGVSIDAGPYQVLSSFSATLRKQQVLFSTPVSPGHHTLTITNWENGPALGVDQFIYRPVSSAASQTSSSSVSAPPPSSSQPVAAVQTVRIPEGVYVGLGLGAAALFVMLVLAAVVLWQRRRRQRAQQVQPRAPPGPPPAWAAFDHRAPFGGPSSHSPFATPPDSRSLSSAE